MNKTTERVEKLLAYLNASPDDNFLQHALGLEYVREGKDEEARALFENILKRDPFYIGTYYHLGKLLERRGDIDAALHCYHKGMDAAKTIDSRKAYHELETAWLELNDE